MFTNALFAILLSQLASATYYDGGKDGSGYYYEGAYGQTSLSEVPNIEPFQAGASTPNASNTVSFHGFTWRTTVSDVSVDDATTQPPNGTAILDAHVISTIFDLSWQGNGTIGDALQKQGAVTPYGCIMMIDGLGLANNVTSAYSAADNGTCTHVLGDACVADFLAALKTGNGTGCPAIPSPADLPSSCAGTLGTTRGSFNGITEDLEQLQGRPAPNVVQNGQGFAHILSSAYNGSDVVAALQEAESRLQILVVKSLNVVACQKVNSTVTVSATPTPAGAAPTSTTTGAADISNRLSRKMLGLSVLGLVLPWI